jgi:hypothetical protein
VYRIAVRNLDRQRLKLEETLEETLKVLQKWETERLRAVKTGMSVYSLIYPTHSLYCNHKRIALLQYQGTVANLPKSLDPPIERSSTLIAAFQPETDLTALIERYRTGPFRPDPQVYESVAHDECDVVFGIDLRKWSEGAWDGLSPTGQSEEWKEKENVPSVVSALLGGLTEAYKALPDDGMLRGVVIHLWILILMRNKKYSETKVVDIRCPFTSRPPPTRSAKRRPTRPTHPSLTGNEIRCTHHRKYTEIVGTGVGSPTGIV